MSITGRRGGAGLLVPNDGGSSVVTSDILINSRFKIRFTNLESIALVVKVMLFACVLQAPTGVEIG